MGIVSATSSSCRLLLPALFLPAAVAFATTGTTTNGTCGLAASQNLGSFTNCAMNAVTNPTGNPTATNTTLAVEGTTQNDDQREFLVSLGLVSDKGSRSRPTPYHDKGTLYTGIVAHNGTGDVWSINPLVTQSPNSGDYNAQGIELDFNNLNEHRGDADGGGGLAPPVSYGFSVTGAGNKRSTASMMVSGPGSHRIWNRGLVFANDCVEQSTFQDLGNPDKSVDIRGCPKYGVFQNCASSKNYFAGKTGVGERLTSNDGEKTTLSAEAEAEAAKAGAALEVGGSVLFTGTMSRLDVATGQREAVMLVGQPVKSQDGKEDNDDDDDDEGDNQAVPSHGAQVTHSGNARLDERGQAVVNLPASVLRRTIDDSHRYQLTALGAPMPDLHILEELGQLRTRPGREESGAAAAAAAAAVGFVVAGGQPGRRVSWTVVSELK